MLKRLAIACSMICGLSNISVAAELPFAESYAKIPPIALEYWDENGIFRMVNMELYVAFPGNFSVKKDQAERIARELSGIAWQDLVRTNPASVVKKVAYDILKSDPRTDAVREVLVQKLVLR